MKMNQLAHSLFIMTLLLTCGYAFAAPKESPPPGMGKYVIVLWEPGTPIPNNPKRFMKRVEEPDIAKSGGKLLATKNNVRVVYLPFAAAKQLQKHEAVSYIQRIWTGESIEGWDEKLSMERGRQLASEDDTDLEWGPKSYSYDGSGNIKKIGVDEYTYDSAGRLIRSVVSGKTETFEYDAFGNLTKKAVAGTNAVEIPVDASSNRLVGPEYDAAGNMTTSARRQYEYDSLNALTYTTSIGGTHRLLYDANEERIGTLIDSSLSRWTVRDFDGQILREYKGDYMFWIWEQDHVRGEGQLLGGERQEWWYSPTQAHYGGLRHYHLDHLGSVRMVTNKDGRSLSENDYYAFGTTLTKTYQEPINWGDPFTDGMRFAGHWRDFLGYPQAETNEYIDYMHARNYDPNLGRFLSVDPTWASADPGTPQSWNRYSYVWNNPINANDPTGKILELVGTKALQDEVEDIANQSLYNVDLVIGSNGTASLQPNNVQGPPTPQQAAMQETLTSAIGSTSTTRIGLTSNSTSVLMDSYDRNTIDVGDIAAVARVPGAPAAGILGHAVEEQYQKQRFGLLYRPAHALGLRAEDAINGSTRGRISGSVNASGTGTLIQPYTQGGNTVNMVLTIRNLNILCVDMRSQP